MKKIIIVSLTLFLCFGLTYAGETVIYRGGNKTLVYDHGAKNADYTIDLSMAEMHVVSFTAAANLTISSSLTNDKAMVVVKNGAYNVTLVGVDNNSPTLTAAANTQDLLGFTKAFGKITCGAYLLNQGTE